MITRGLRLKKFPTTVYLDSFVQQWEQALTDCSLTLMRLIVTHEESLLLETRTEIQHMELFNTLDSRIQQNLSKLEKSIADIKQKKYTRGIQDYATNSVYLWHKNGEGMQTPRSILKTRRRRYRRKSPQRVNFGSTSIDTSDTQSEVSDSASTSATGNTNIVYNPVGAQNVKPALQKTQGGEET